MTSIGNIAQVGIIGGGAWGTALAQTLSSSGKGVTLWAYEPDTVREINEFHLNRIYLPGVDLNPQIRATGKLSEVADCDVMLLVAPVQNLRAIATELAGHVKPETPVVICSKGIEQSTGKMLSQVVAETMPGITSAVLSGPSFAADVARGLPAAVTLACKREEIGEALAEGLGYRQFRIYWSRDELGVQLGGAVKNVLAIAAGIVDGKQLGPSAHAAIVARGFAELVRLGTELGAEAETLVGLSGLGDLILTCGSANSRNMSLGRALGQGRSLEETLGARSAVTEGVFTADAVTKIANEKNVDMPICQAVHTITTGTATVDDAIATLLARPMRSEV